jgi:Zn-dependent protease with chaperone function
VRRSLALAVLLIATGACSTVPDRSYYPDPASRETKVLANALWRAAKAASDDPNEYSFAMIRSHRVAAYTVEDATFYFTQGLARQPDAIIDALVAHEVAHELLGHLGQRRALSLSFLRDFVANPLIVRAYTRDQEIAADLKAADLLGLMGHEAPRRLLAGALQAAGKVNGRPPGGGLATEPGIEERAAALEPLEPLSGVARKPPDAARP